MRSVEASGKTREEATQSALQELGVELYEVDKIEILDEGSKGFFGLGARPVRVKLTVDRLSDAPKKSEKGADRERRQERGERGERGGRGDHGGRRDRGPRRDRGERTEQRGERTEQRGERTEQRGERSEQRGERSGRDRQDRDRDRGGRHPQGGRPQRRDRSEGRDRRPERSDRRPQAAPRPAPVERVEKQPEPQQPEEENEDMALNAAEDGAVETGAEVEVRNAVEAAVEEASFAPISDAQGNEAAALLQEVIAKMDITAKVEFARGEDGSARLNVESEDGALLIGRKGRNLGALQYIINRVISRGDVAENTERIVVDVEGYVGRRRETLEDIARNFAARAKQTGRNMRLKPMSPQERRIIHVTLQDDPDVRTFSLGEALYRSVVISPKNQRQDRPRYNRDRGRGRGGQRYHGNRSRRRDYDAGSLGD